MQAAVNKRRRLARQAWLAVRLQDLAGQIEKLLPEVRAVIGGEGERAPVASAARSLERAASALASAAGRARHGAMPEGISELLEGTSPLLSLFGSRVVLAGAAGGSPPRPSAAAQALAVLLEEPKRSFEAAEVAMRLACSVPAARTTLNRLVRSGHADRPAPGRFRARSR